MYHKVKNTLLAIIYVILWCRYFVALWDPLAGNLDVSQGMAPYRDWRFLIDGIYGISAYLMWPVNTLYYDLLANVVPPSDWFPGFYMANLLTLLQAMSATNPQAQQILNAPAVAQAMVGYLDYLVLFAALFYWLLSPLLDVTLDFLKNVVWNLLIEMSFTKRKEGRYQEALEKRAADLVKLNVEFKNLSKENNVLAQSVITDELTRVYNKRFFIEKITYEFNQAKAKKQVLAVAMIDIDHFKKLNDNYGHLMGDKVLKAVAQVAKGNTPNDCFCCRFGGEEFSIIMPGKTVEEAIRIIAKTHQSLPLLRFEDDNQLRTSASFGICVVDFKTPEGQALKSFEDLLKLADDELYKAKLNGRNRIEHCSILFA
ncbi:GGDEF domain-containing protein [Vampirovibrio sp.]|uniref:GGDEF domain-containing protein n=1 Tax=Vampirovibrio sp. TaxID=2717857 RepID=UPI003593CA2A